MSDKEQISIKMKIKHRNPEIAAFLLCGSIAAIIIIPILLMNDGYFALSHDFTTMMLSIDQIISWIGFHLTVYGSIAWLAGESWRQEVFRNNGDIYCASASQMFGVPVEKHGVNGELRQKGKIAELALGYGGGVGAMISMGAIDMGLAEEELQPIVDSWRQSNTAIVKLWWDVHRCVIKAVKDKQPQTYKCLTFEYQSGMLFIGLPSGRRLAYAKPSVYRNDYDRDEIAYMGVDATKKWGKIDSYGPKFVENIIQAMSRDILAEAMARMEAAGYDIVMHVHDEAVIEAPRDAVLEDACQIMSKAPDWTPGLILNAAGYECEFYQKD